MELRGIPGAVLLVAALSAGCATWHPAGAPAEGTPRDEFLAQTGEFIALDAIAAYSQLEYVRVQASAQEDGELRRVEMSLTPLGDCQGEIRFGAAKASVVRRDREAFVNGNEPFWQEVIGGKSRAKRAEAASLADRWVPDGGTAEDLDEICDLDELMAGLMPARGWRVKGLAAQVAGRETIEVHGQGRRVWVSVKAPHLVLKADDGEDTYLFSEFDVPFEVELPEGDDVLGRDVA